MIVVALLAPFARSAHRRWAVAAAVGVAVTLASASTPARAGDAEIDASLLETVRTLALDKSSEAERGGGSGKVSRIDVSVGALDPRLHLAPCQRIEPYLPPGMRLWGKSRVGLRCTQGPVAWNVYLPVTVKVYGRALVVPAGATAGSTVGIADLAEAEVDLAEEQTAALVDPRQAVGRVLAQNLRPGQTLRAGHLKLRQYFTAGETVKVVATGDGFALESEGQALGNGVEGLPARVRTENGRVLTGLPAGDRRLEVAL